MTVPDVELPLWLAVVITAFLLLGAGLSLIGCIGLVRFSSFYERLHMPTLCTTWGIGGVIIASWFYSWFYAERAMWSVLLLTIFMVLTTPATLMMVARAASQRDCTNDWSELPHKIPASEPEAPFMEGEELRKGEIRKRR